MKKISYKIWLGIMAVVLLLCMLIVGFQRYFLEGMYRDNLVTSVSKDVFVVLDGFDADNPEDTYFQLDALAYKRNISVEMINKDGKTIYVTGENPGSTFERIDVMESQKMLFLATIGELEKVPVELETWKNDSQLQAGGPESGSGRGTGDGEGTGAGQGGGDAGQGTDDGEGAGDGQGTGDGEGTGDGHSTSDPEGPKDPTERGKDYHEFQFIPEGEERESIIEKALEGNEDVEEATHPKYGFRLLILSITFSSEQGDPYVAMAAIPLAEIDEIVALISMALLVSIPLILIIAGLAAYAVASTVSRPLRRLSTAAEAIGDGYLETRTEVKSGDEVGNLGRTFNVMAERLQKADRMKREFVENVSHELRTPISVIRGYAETIRDVTGDNKEKRDIQLNVISSEANRLGVMVSDILDYSKMTSEGIVLEPVEFDLDDLVQDQVSKYQVLVKDSNITVEYHSSGHMRIKGDRTRLEQTIENLLRNAINYSPDGGAVQVLVTGKDDSVRVEISDQGVGIPKDEIRMIWERYYRTKGIKKRKIYGSGLGLSIVKNILEAHKARYGADSVPGEGTTFWFELPMENL